MPETCIWKWYLRETPKHKQTKTKHSKQHPWPRQQTPSELHSKGLTSAGESKLPEKLDDSLTPRI